MTKKYPTSPTPPSDIFLDSLERQMGVGCDEMECGYCGRMHYCPDNDFVDRDYEDQGDYLAHCLEEKRKDPEGVVIHYNTDGVSGRQLNGVNFVLECPCNGLYRYEQFIWQDRALIRDYLKARIDQEHDFYVQEKTANKLAGLENDDEARKRFWWTV